MLIDFESIIIFNNSVCEDFLNGNVSFEIIQVIEPLNPKANCFIQVPPVIQCINPSLNDEGGKLKFSVTYKPNGSYVLKNAMIVFNKKIESSVEVRRKNEIILSENIDAKVLSVSPSVEDGQLNIDFREIYDENHDISEALSELNNQNEINKMELSVLEKQLSDITQANKLLIEKKNQTLVNIETCKKEVSEMNSVFEDYDDLVKQKEILRENFESNSENIRLSEKLKKQISYYDDILSYYKKENEYASVSDKLKELTAELDEIQTHIAVFAEKRSDEINTITNELNI